MSYRKSGLPRNPWAICTAAVGRRDRAKYERCVRAVKTRMGMKNPAISAVWGRMTPRQRWAAMEFAGIGEERARAYSHESWMDLPDDAKRSLLRSWDMGSVGGTTRRHKGETTRRMPVLTNPVAKPFAVQGSHSYLSTFKGGGWKVYESYDSYKDAMGEAKWLMKGGLALGRDPFQPGSRNRLIRRVQTVVLKPVNERRYTVYWRQVARAASNGNRLDRARAVIQRAERDLGPLTPGQLNDLLLDNMDDLRDSKEAHAILVLLGRAVKKNGTKGAYPFTDKQKQYRSYTMPQLRYALKDAAETARLWKGQDPATENWYRDDVFTISDEIRRRGVRTNPSVPVWMRSEEAFFKKFGTTRERLGKALARLSDEKKMEFHQKVDKTFSEAAVRWALKQGGIGAERNPSSPPTIWRKRKRGAKTSYYRGPDPKFRTYYVAKYRPAYPQTGEFWTASTVIDALPPTVVGKLFKIAARTKADAIREARSLR